MKKVISLCLIICFMSISAFALAAEYNWPIKSKMFTTDTADDSTITAGVLIYGIKCIGTANSAQVGIYDCSTLMATSNSNIVDEDGAASKYDSSFSPLAAPIKLETGGTILVSNAYALVFYRP